MSKNQPLQSFDENWIACIHVLITQIAVLAGNALDFNGTNNLLFNACTSRNHLTVYTWRLVCWSSFFFVDLFAVGLSYTNIEHEKCLIVSFIFYNKHNKI